MKPLAFLAHPSRLRRFLAASTVAPPRGNVFAAQARRFTVAQMLVYAFYAFLLYTPVGQFGEQPILLDRHVAAPLWPVAWFHRVGAVTAPPILVAFYLATNILGAFVVSWRAGRVLTFLGLLEYVALKNSLPKIGHSLHLLVYVAAVFILLPAGWDRPAPQTSRAHRQETLLVFWLAQAVLLMSYTMSGAAKLAAALYQLFAGQPNAFFPGGLSAIVAQRLLETRATSFFGAWIVHHPFLTWPAFPAAIYLELFAFLVAFRPALARPWAAGLVLLHVASYFTMTISFPQSCFLLAIFFLASPFEPDSARTWHGWLPALPLFANIYRFARTKRRSRGFYLP